LAVFHAPQPLNLEAIKTRRRLERLARKEEEQRQALLLCDRYGLAQPTFEGSFYPARQWRLDLAWPEYQVAVEQDGGLFIDGKHARGPGILKDQAKRNTAQFLGWTLFVFTPPEVYKGAYLSWVKGAIERRKAGG
jgi:hypothetical protein